MNRLAKTAFGSTLLTNYRLSTQLRNRYFSSQRSSKLKLTLVTGSGIAAATTLTLLYAKYDPSFRQQISQYLPFINSLLQEERKLVDANSYEASFLPSKPIKPVDKKPVQVPVPVVEQKESPSQSNKNEAKKPQSVQLDENEVKQSIAKTLEKAFNEDNVELTTRDSENELRTQLKRQLYVFQDYFKEQFIQYKSELKRKLEIDLKNQVLVEKANIANDYEEAFKKLKRMEALLEIRDQLDKQEKATKSLWLLGQTLTNLLEHNRSVLTKEAQPINIGPQVEIIRKVVAEHFPQETLINVALEALPENALKHGVYSEEDLIRRYPKVEMVCNHVTLVNNEYTTLLGYLRSWAYSYVRPFQEIEFNFSTNPIQVKQISSAELDGTLQVNPSQWDTYDILQRVKLSIENRNLEMALRYANQLTGEPRKVAKDWIRDTREHLEVKQTVQLIQSKIAAINLHQVAFTH